MIALTRGIPATFAQATTAVPADPPIDVARARTQHDAYRRALRAIGLEVVTLPADDRFPDGCFVEDCAVLAGGVALITRPGAPSRRGEVDAIEDALVRIVGDAAVHRMEAPATLDGGDCLRVGRTLFIGASARTNAEGIARATAVFAPHGIRVVAVPMPSRDVLHLKCVCSPLGDDRVLLAEGTLPASTFDGFGVVTIPASEAYAANCLAYDGPAIVAEGFPETLSILRGEGLRVTPLDTSEIHKADGALTCLSILVDH